MGSINNINAFDASSSFKNHSGINHVQQALSDVATKEWS